MSLLDVTDLTIRYNGKTVVDGVDLFVERGESVGLVGESGSGKTQSALAIMGLLPPQAEVSGSVRFDGNELVGANSELLNSVRARRIGMVFQDPMQALNPYVRIGKQLRRVLLEHGLARRSEVDEQVVAMLERVGLPDAGRQFRAYPHELSGGMRQRVMIASALIAGPDLLIADEPTTALDVTVQAQILDLLEEIRDHTALLLITHDLSLIAGHCEHMVVLENGRLVEAGQTTSMFSAPRHAHTRALLATAARIDSEAPAKSATGKNMLSVEDVVVSYPVAGGQALRAVVGVDLSLATGETLAVVGESGSGKTSLVRAILGLLPISTGTVVYAGQPLGGAIASRSLSKRRDLQLIFQDPMSALNPQMRIAAIVAEPLLVHEPSMPATEREVRVVEALHEVGLDETRLRQFPHQLSGGQAQRVAIARALIVQPKVLICDEAVAALDGAVRERVLGLLTDIQRRTGLAIIFISHDLAVVRTISHRVAVMYMGRLVEIAECEALFTHPRHPYTKALIQAVPVPDPRVPPRAAPLPGEIPSLLNPPPGCVFHPRCVAAKEDCGVAVPILRDIAGTRVACIRAEEL